MYKVTNVFKEERGFETDGKLFVLKPNESVIVKKAPLEIKGMLKVEKAEKKAEKPAEEKPKEKPKEEVK